VRHPRGGGEIVIRSLTVQGDPCVEVLAVDRGPGMANLSDSLRDGHSTGGTPGTGLGAIARLSHTFDVFTNAATGTVLLSQLAAAAAAPPAVGARPLELGVVCLPKKGEPACGDAWHAAEVDAGRTLVLVADGLGHGLHAAEASRLAVRVFRDNLHRVTAQIVEALHAALRPTRGAAVAVAELRPGQGEVRFTGVGNVAAAIIGNDGKGRSLVSHNGTAGAEARRIQEFVYPWQDGNLLVMHSDGLGSQWQLSQYAGLRSRHPAVIAGVLYRDFRRERDDVTVLVFGSGGIGRVAKRA
ncbi:MAG TPA: SpoIIE family protein phosphatase, partial [Tepidisphaeraceae bacterium]|nr:SpoIIE family protein phosphatase [Tepidisphaeraceae bacterium]